MTAQVLSDISSALTTVFAPDLARQFNRLSVLAQALPKKKGAGGTCSWDVRFSRSNHAGAFTEGSDVNLTTEVQQDITVPASLAWGQYRAAFGMSGISLASAASAIGSPRELLELFRGHLDDAASDLISQINAALYTGAGTSNAIAGLYGAGVLALTGTYAGVDRSTYPEWASNLLSNGGAARALTKSLLDQAEQSCFDDCSMPPDLIVASSGVVRKYESLFDTVVRTQPANASGQGELSVIQRLQANSGYTGLFYKGVPVLRDRNASSGKLAMLNTQYVDIQTLPPVLPGMMNVPSQRDMNLAAEGQEVGIMARVEPLAKTGDTNNFQLVAYLQMRCRRCNANCGIVDISES